MKIHLLGSPAVRLPNHLTPRFTTSKVEGLLYYLAVTRQPHTRVQLATLFWGDMPEKNARVSLSKALSNLREQVGEYVTITTQTIVFNTMLPYDLDVERFLTPPTPGEAPAALQARTDLYRGELLDGFYVRDAPDFEQWQRGERERFHNHAVQLLTTLAARYQQSGQGADAMNTLRRLLRVEPWREEAHYQLMTLLAQQGETTSALRQYELCRATLAAELAVEPGEAITKLYQQLRAKGKAPGATSAPFVAALSSPVSGQSKPVAHLPQLPTRFVGRAAEINVMAARLQEPACRLLTLIGPGGIGKTRLALEVARTFVDTPAITTAAPLFSEGVFFVDLMPIESAAGIIAAIAEAVGFNFYNNTPPRQQLLNYLKARTLLLLLDNFEHLCPESGLIADLLAAAPRLKVLVTSRDALPLQSAYLHLVQGLDYAADQPAADATATDAVRLFVQCAQRHQATFSLTPNLGSVTQICRTVGGLPLALELAATWLRTLSCAQIAQELDKGVALLRANLLDIPERHRDMRMVFEQSWQRLNADEATVMERLALFRGGFTLAAAESVTAASIQTLATLSEKALIRLDESRRYQIHELLRQFAVEKLSVGKVQAEAAAAHARFFLQLAAQLQTYLTDHRQQAALATLQADIDNLRTAWFWALQQPDLPGIAEALDSLYLFYLFTCRYSEGKELFTTSGLLLENLTVLAVSLSVQLATRAAVFAYHLGEYEQPAQHFHLLLVTTPATVSPGDMAIAHMILGLIAGWQGRNTEAESYLRQSITLYQAQGDYSSVATALHGMAEMYAHAGAYQKAVDSAQSCLEIGVQLRRDDLIGSAHYTLGYAHKSLGDSKLALHHYQQGCVFTEKTGDRLGYALSVGGVGIELCQLGKKQWSQGFALIQQSLALCREIGHFVHIITRLFSLADACIHGNRYAEAIPLAQECVQLAKTGNLRRGISFGLLTLAESYYGMANWTICRLYLQQSASIAITIEYHGLAHAVIVYGLLLENEANQLTAMAAIQNRVNAVVLVTSALRRPAWHRYQQKAKQLLERQRDILTTDQFATAQALADQQTLEALATQIIGLGA